MKKFTIEDIEEIEQRLEKVGTERCGSRADYISILKDDMPRLIADNKRLRLALNKIAGAANDAS